MQVSKTENLIDTPYEDVECKTQEELRSIINNMPWDQLSAVQLYKDGVTIEGSGSVEDGFSVGYSEGGYEMEIITPTAPLFDDMVCILERFYIGDESWRDNRAWKE